MFDKKIDGILKKFRNTTIGATDWDRVISRFNLGYIVIEGLIIFIIASIILNYVLPFSFQIIGLISLVIAYLRINVHFRKFNNFLEVPPGHIGIILLLGDRKGSMKDGDIYYLKPGKYRDIVDIVTYKDIFDIIIISTNWNNFDYHFKDVFSKDGVAMEGTHTGRPQLVDPYAWADLLLASGDPDIHFKKIEDISLEAMNNASDNLTISQIIKTHDNEGDGSDNFKREYFEELNELIQLQPYKEPFLSNINWEREKPYTVVNGEKKYKKFYFPETGLNIMFNIKTRKPMNQDMVKALAAGPMETENAKAIKIKAEAQKIKLTLEGEGKAAAEKALTMATHEVFTTSLKDNLSILSETNDGVITEEIRKEAIHHASLDANQYAHEILTAISQGDGSKIEGSLEKIMAMIMSMFEKK